MSKEVDTAQDYLAKYGRGVASAIFGKIILRSVNLALAESRNASNWEGDSISPTHFDACYAG